MAHPFRMDGRRALITGAAQGIGRAIALAFHEAGAQVLAHDRDAEKLNVMARAHPGVIPLVMDLARPGSAGALVSAARSVGTVDILVLCASVQRRRPWQEALGEPAEVELAVNFDATRILLNGFVPEMARQGWGRILAIGSVQERAPRADMIIYAALKAAQTNMIVNLARELGPSGVTCNVLSPGVIETDRNGTERKSAGRSAMPCRRS